MAAKLDLKATDDRTDDDPVVRGAAPPGAACESLEVPLLPLAESVVFPGSVHPLALQGDQAEQLVETARALGGLVALFLQRQGSPEEPTPESLHGVGTLARLTEVTKSDDGVIEATAEGIEPVRLQRVEQFEPHATALVEICRAPSTGEPSAEELASTVRGLYLALLDAAPASAGRLRAALDISSSPRDLAYLVAATIPVSPAARQAVLEAPTAAEALSYLIPLLKKALEMASVSASAAASAQPGPEPARIPTSGGGAVPRPLPGPALLDQATLDRQALEARLAAAHLSPEAERAARLELQRLSLLAPTSPDYNMVRSYLQWLADLPWAPDAPGEIDLRRAAAILDRDHFGLGEVKRRILEHLAVLRLRSLRAPGDGQAHLGPDFAQPVICLVGPPGVGKTSLGRSIAAALGRPFVRISLGGVSDEAEIRGHRRTYLGAMPGRILQSLARVKSNRPVIMLDELDKVGSQGKGDPMASLLDVLDPEQQTAFVDHYIDVPFDISGALFLATANTLDSIPEALRDRLEVVRLPGYVETEKLEIALRHLIPKQMEWHAVARYDLEWKRAAVLEIIRSYTREAGVRQLQRQIATVCRRVAAAIAGDDQGAGARQVVDAGALGSLLGSPPYPAVEARYSEQPGVVTAVFWTPVGGETMPVEALTMPGSGRLMVTGQLGEVMRESAQAALSYVRAHAGSLGIDPCFYDRSDIHLHIPSGAVPKDGPSAGAALVAALVSLLAGRAVPGDLAMTGEITLTGRILPVGGIREKVLAARRAGLRRLVLPALNRRDAECMPSGVLCGIQVEFAETIEDVLRAALPCGSHKAGSPVEWHWHDSERSGGRDRSAARGHLDD